MVVVEKSSARAEKDAAGGDSGSGGADLPPPYSPIEDGYAPQPAPEYGDLDPPKVVHPRTGMIVVTNELAPTRPLYLHADKVASSSLIVESAHGPSANGMLSVRVEVSGGGSDISDKCDVSMAVNGRGEYEIYAVGKRIGWTGPRLECQFVVQIPAGAPLAHPGIRAVLSKAHVGLGGLDNVAFGHIDIQTSHASVSLSRVSSDSVLVTTSHGAIDAASIDCQGTLSLTTNSGHISVADSKCGELHAATTNKQITLQSCTSDAVSAVTTNSKIQCGSVAAETVRLQTTNSSIEAGGIDAGSLWMATTNSSIKGAWNVRDLLDLSTTNSRITGDIGLLEPERAASITLTTTNAGIDVRLKRNAFSGRFDLKTTNAAAQILGDNGEDPDSMSPLRYVVNTQTYKRGTCGAGDKLRHDLAAKTTNSRLNVSLVDY
ncbi:hypothetical protein H4R19_002032 [Coemansia spiralis]|nr:hypothetical protein H4R19_002032 [Coemansia spiralis]